MLPVLMALSESNATPSMEIRNRVMVSEGLTTSDVLEMLPSGKQSKLTNRVAWAIVHMRRAGLVERVSRGVYRLSPEGEKLLSKNPERVDIKTLSEYKSYKEWRTKANPNGDTKKPTTDVLDDTVVSPTEAIDNAFQNLKGELAADLLGRIQTLKPEFLEKIVVDLLIAMGYGGGDSEMGNVSGKPGDHGIDGTIREDKLGLDEVYVQAKKFAPDHKVGEGDLRNFAGAIDATGTSKGVFVTTSSFSPAAEKYVNKSPKRIVLIDGNQLAHYLIDFSVGVRIGKSYDIKHIDEDYFDPEYP